MKKLSTLYFALSCSLAALAMPCTSMAADIPPGTQLAPEQVLNFNFGTVGTLDPTFLNWNEDFDYNRMLFETLVVQSPDGTFKPGAAQSYESSEDGLTWTFHLRPDAKWSDGKPVTAHDFVYAWQRLADPVSASTYAGYLNSMGVVNASQVIAGKLPVTDLGVEAKDDLTFVIHLNTPTPWLDTMLPIGVLSPLRKDIIDKYGANWTQPDKIVGNGPFLLNEYRINDIMTFSKNPLYWDAKHNVITKINGDFIQDSNANYYGFITGKYLLSNIPSQFKKIVNKQYKKDIITADHPSIQWLIINAKRIPNVDARKAISLLIDRHILAAKVIQQFEPTSLLVPQDLAGAKYMEQQPWFDQAMSERRAQAQQLLEKAGYTRQNPLVIKYMTTEAKNNKVFVAIQNFLSVGSGGRVKLEIDVSEAKVFYTRYNQHNYDMAMTGWNADYPQVTTFLDLFKCNSSSNVYYYCDAKYDKLLDQALHSNDADTRAKLYAQAQSLVNDSYILLPLFHIQFTLLKNPRLQGYNPNSQYKYYNDYYILAKDPK